MGDFNVDLLKYEDDANTLLNFLDKFYSISLIPQITSPTRTTSWLEMLIDNIFSVEANSWCRNSFR